MGYFARPKARPDYTFSHPFYPMNGIRNFLFAGLALGVVALGLLVHQQHALIRSLRQIGEPVATVAPASPVEGARVDEISGARAGVPEDWRTLPTVSRVGGQGADEHQDHARTASLAALLENPQFLRALVSHQRTMLDNRYAPLFSQLQLSAEELDMLRGLLIEKQNSALDVMMVTSRGAVPGAGAREVRRATQQAQGEIDAEIRRTLGDDRYAVFNAFEATLPQRATVAQLTQRLSYTDTPLQPAQAEALVSTLAESGGGNESLPGVSVVLSPEDRRAVPIVQSTAEASRITDEVVVRSAEVLAPAQIAALRQLQAEQSAAATMVRLARGTMPPSASGPASSTLLDGLDIHLLLQ